jgi:hypothetical protein
MNDEREAIILTEPKAKSSKERTVSEESSYWDAFPALTEVGEDAAHEEQEEDDLPEALEPEARPSFYSRRPVFGDWDEERPSDGELKPSYEDALDDGAPN